MRDGFQIRRMSVENGVPCPYLYGYRGSHPKSTGIPYL